MPHLVNALFDRDELDLDLGNVYERGEDYFTKRPGFFTPYENGYDIANDLLNPIEVPVVSLVVSGVCLMVAAAAIVTCVASLVAAGLVAIVDTDSADDILEFTDAAGELAILCMLMSSIALLVSAVSLFTEPFRLVSRTVASIDALCTDGDDDEFDPYHVYTL